MKKRDFLLMGFLTILYLLNLFFFHRHVFTYRFDIKLIDRYFCSQDIPYEPNCPRVWLSDEELHIAAGYLYATGSDPAVIDFQHTPFTAYLYGFSILLFNNPYLVEILFGILFIVLVYILGKKIYHLSLVPFIACLFLLTDPLFLDLSTQASYELVQGVLLLLYINLMLFDENNYIFQGVALGLLCSAKFWGAAVFFVLLINSYKMFNKTFKLKIFLRRFAVAFIIFSLTYTKTFMNNHFSFNIIYFQLKILKYWIDHSITNIPFASFILFLTGSFKSWWGDNIFLRTQIWSIFWPISLISSIFAFINIVLKRKVTIQNFIAIIPVIYLIYLGVQAPFSRYFILILPFCYLSLTHIILSNLRKHRLLKKT